MYNRLPPLIMHNESSISLFKIFVLKIILVDQMLLKIPNSRDCLDVIELE